MAKLSSEDRKELPKKDFGEPGKRKFPMPDKGHAEAAKGRATQGANRVLKGGKK